MISVLSTVTVSVTPTNINMSFYCTKDPKNPSKMASLIFLHHAGHLFFERYMYLLAMGKYKIMVPGNTHSPTLCAKKAPSWWVTKINELLTNSLGDPVPLDQCLLLGCNNQSGLLHTTVSCKFLVLDFSLSLPLCLGVLAYKLRSLGLAVRAC